ncbi:MAG: hypothetical protein RIS47_1103, partial [Bacteroidota bacterium]
KGALPKIPEPPTLADFAWAVEVNYLKRIEYSAVSHGCIRRGFRN